MPFGLGLLIFVTTFLQSKVNFVFSFFPMSSNELISLITEWITFTVLIKISISIKLYWKILLLSSFIIAFVWTLVHKFFLWYIAHSVMYLTIYGSFASIFFFFLWIYISWIIYLYGLKLCKILHVND